MVGQSNILADPRYIGRACYGRVSGNIRVKLQFVIMGHADHYEALKTTLFNNTEGEIDTNLIRLKDIWGIKPSHNPNFRDGISPHIWKGHQDYEWYAYEPTPADYEKLSDSVDEYLEMFSEDMEYGQTMA